MEHLDLWWWLLLGGGAFVAGLVDAVVGGGGLVQVPLLLAVFPTVPVPILFGTNKLSSIAGTASAAWHYAKEVHIPRSVAIPGAIAALIGAWLGAGAVSLIPTAWLRPMVLILLVVVGTYTWLRPQLGQQRGEAPPRYRGAIMASVIGGGIGFYDGFFGPGTGSFLILAFVKLFRMDMLQASATAKVLNFATNLAAIVFFALFHGVLWAVGLVMAVCNVAGAQVGARLAVRHGNAFVRVLFLVVVSVLALKLGYDVIKA
ncbi:sulfite exporter TauE/SafE family protein [Uliginosibacterium sp. H1]|uniref:sulfite exporter TauE/SafE family protein n=1 Tax=Uliginosibacterium sp. H1 TaxID=3114757 RepID=UPI002E18D945|nr:TSUP family transporter [Uliginosibacterium sp. H1]